MITPLSAFFAMHKFGTLSLEILKTEDSRGIHTPYFKGRNIQIHTIVSKKIALLSLPLSSVGYIRNYTLLAYISHVKVLHQKKFK